jgi:hypothetical protein
MGSPFIFIGEIIMNENELEIFNDGDKVIDLKTEAKKAGIEMPVSMSKALVKELRPSPYLASLGICLDVRITNLLSLLRANISPAKQNEKKHYIPLMLLRGPFVREDFQPVIATIVDDGMGQKRITLDTMTNDSEEEI